MDNILSYFGYNSRLWYDKGGNKIAGPVKKKRFADLDLFIFDIIGIILGLSACIMFGYNCIIMLAIIMTIFIIASLLSGIAGTYVSGTVAVISGIEIFISISVGIFSLFYFFGSPAYRTTTLTLAMIIMTGVSVVLKSLRMFFNANN